MSLPTYRLTGEDLPDADKKTKAAIDPLLSALNVCLARVITALNSLEVPALKTTSFTTTDLGAAYVDISTGTPPGEVWVTSLVPNAGILDTVYSMSWVPTAAGVRLLFVGLYPLTTYALKVRYL